MKTSELTGDKLDYWVAKTVGVNVYFDAEIKGKLYSAEDGDSYSPSTNWAQGGPLIEYYKIRSHIDYTGIWHAIHPNESTSNHDVTCDVHPANRAHGQGETLLIAAMRCLVAGAYGEEVPNE